MPATLTASETNPVPVNGNPDGILKLDGFARAPGESGSDLGRGSVGPSHFHLYSRPSGPRGENDTSFWKVCLPPRNPSGDNVSGEILNRRKARPGRRERRRIKAVKAGGNGFPKHLVYPA